MLGRVGRCVARHVGEQRRQMRAAGRVRDAVARVANVALAARCVRFLHVDVATDFLESRTARLPQIVFVGRSLKCACVARVGHQPGETVINCARDPRVRRPSSLAPAAALREQGAGMASTRGRRSSTDDDRLTVLGRRRTTIIVTVRGVGLLAPAVDWCRPRGPFSDAPNCGHRVLPVFSSDELAVGQVSSQHDRGVVVFAAGDTRDRGSSGPSCALN